MAGGRSLTAIWQSALCANEKLVLLYIASEMNFTGLQAMMQPRWIPVGRITAATSLSRATVFTIIRRLEHAGYICRSQRYQANMQLPNSYCLTGALRADYVQFHQILL
jgi:DNA-binding MarR family transcriptional regulator